MDGHRNSEGVGDLKVVNFLRRCGYTKCFLSSGFEMRSNERYCTFPGNQTKRNVLSIEINFRFFVTYFPFLFQCQPSKQSEQSRFNAICHGQQDYSDTYAAVKQTLLQIPISIDSLCLPQQLSLTSIIKWCLLYASKDLAPRFWTVNNVEIVRMALWLSVPLLV